MSKEKAEEMAFQFFQSGFHCAEAISKSLTGLLAKDGDNYTPKVATGFGGGIGGSHLDICGALTGGIIALGWLFGRANPGEDKTRIFGLASEFRKRFGEKFGSCSCPALLEKFGKQENGMKCKKMTAQAAGMLWELLNEKGESKT